MVMAKVVPADDTAVPSTGFKKFAKKLEVAQASSGTYANNHYTSPGASPSLMDLSRPTLTASIASPCPRRSRAHV